MEKLHVRTFFLIYFNKNLIANIETIKAVIIPVIKIINSEDVNVNPNLRSLSKDAPPIAGIAK